MLIFPTKNSKKIFYLIEKKSGRYTIKELENLLKKSFVKLVLYKEEKNAPTPIGYAVIWLFPPEAELHYIEIFREFRNKGHGKAFLKEILLFLKRNHVEKIFLEVRKNNTVALQLYKSLGFIGIGIRKNYYAQTEDAILMEKNLMG